MGPANGKKVSRAGLGRPVRKTLSGGLVGGLHQHQHPLQRRRPVRHGRRDRHQHRQAPRPRPHGTARAHHLQVRRHRRGAGTGIEDCPTACRATTHRGRSVPRIAAPSDLRCSSSRAKSRDRFGDSRAFSRKRLLGKLGVTVGGAVFSEHRKWLARVWIPRGWTATCNREIMLLRT